MKRSLKKLFLIVITITMSFTLFAQVPPPGPPPPVGLPIDGGLAFLLGSGIVYAVSKLRRKE